MRYINVVQGKKRMPRTGQIKLLKAAVKRSGLINHQINVANRGPSRNRVVMKQHIFLSFSHYVFYA
jgi:hypothetical protein